MAVPILQNVSAMPRSPLPPVPETSPIWHESFDEDYFHTRLPRDFGEFVRWNEIANLAQNAKPGPCWFDSLFFMPAVWQVQMVKPTLFSDFLWVPVKKIINNKIMIVGVIVVLLGTAAFRATAQGTFQNLNFELANPGTLTTSPGDPIPYANNVPISDALPYWSVYYGNEQQMGINVNDPSLRAVAVTLIAPGDNPIDGNYSVLLQGGAGNGGSAAASISQTELIPAGMESLLFEAQPGDATLEVLIGTQDVPITAIGNGPNYTLYGANISEWAGDTEELTFSAVGEDSSPNNWEIDDISFSTTAVPEPNAVFLLGIGGLMFTFYRKWERPKRVKPCWLLNGFSESSV